MNNGSSKYEAMRTESPLLYIQTQFVSILNPNCLEFDTFIDMVNYGN